MADFYSNKRSIVSTFQCQWKKETYLIWCEPKFQEKKVLTICSNALTISHFFILCELYVFCFLMLLRILIYLRPHIIFHEQNENQLQYEQIEIPGHQRQISLSIHATCPSVPNFSQYNFQTGMWPICHSPCRSEK